MSHLLLCECTNFLWLPGCLHKPTECARTIQPANDGWGARPRGAGRSPSWGREKNWNGFGGLWEPTSATKKKENTSKAIILNLAMGPSRQYFTSALLLPGKKEGASDVSRKVLRASILTTAGKLGSLCCTPHWCYQIRCKDGSKCPSCSLHQICISLKINVADIIADIQTKKEIEYSSKIWGSKKKFIIAFFSKNLRTFNWRW